MNILIAVIFVLVVLAISATGFFSVGRHKWIALACGIAIGVIAVIMALVFHSWWFILWALVLAGATYLFLTFKSLLWKIIFGLLIIVIIVGGIYIVSKSIHFESKTPIASQKAPADSPKAPAIQSESPAPEEVSKCIEAESIASQKHGDKVLLDLNDGDPYNYGLTIVSPDVPQSDQNLVVITEPGSIFDVVYPVMYFSSYRLKGTEDQILCSASKIAGNNALAYVFVGKGATPKGWTSVNDTSGWWKELVAKEYSDPALDTGGAEWPAFQISVDETNRTIKFDEIVYGQLWNPNVNGIVVHFQIESGYELLIHKWWQGTYWTVPEGAINVQDRIIQASKEVVERDSLKLQNVTLLYCGANIPDTELKVGDDTVKWVTDLDGWECKKNK